MCIESVMRVLQQKNEHVSFSYFPVFLVSKVGNFLAWETGQKWDNPKIAPENACGGAPKIGVLWGVLARLPTEVSMKENDRKRNFASTFQSTPILESTPASFLGSYFGLFSRARRKGISFFSCGATPSRTVPQTQPLQVALSLLERVDLRSQKEGIFGRNLPGEGRGGQSKKRKKGCAKKGGYSGLFPFPASLPGQEVRYGQGVTNGVF